MIFDSKRESVRHTIARLSGVSLEKLRAAGSLDDVFGQLEVIELVFELEETYGMEIDDVEVLRIETVGDLVSCVERRLDAAA